MLILSSLERRFEDRKISLLKYSFVYTISSSRLVWSKERKTELSVLRITSVHVNILLIPLGTCLLE